MEIQWPLVLFTLLSGTGGALAAFAGADAIAKKDSALLRPSCAVAIVLLIVGGICSAAHLAHPLRAIAVISHPAAGIFLEAILLGVLLVLLLALAAAAGKHPSAVTSAIAAATGIVGVALAFFSGVSYMMPAHPAWDTPLLPLCYLATALVAGSSCYGLIARMRSVETRLPIEGTTAICGLAALVCIVAYACTTGMAGSDLTACILASAIFSGVVPIVCSLIARKKESAGVFAISFVSAFAGGVLIRVLMWTAIAWGIAGTNIALL